MKNLKYIVLNSIAFSFIVLSASPLTASANNGIGLGVKADVGNAIHASVENKFNINNDKKGDDNRNNSARLDNKDNRDDKKEVKNDLKDWAKANFASSTTSVTVMQGADKNHCFLAFGHSIVGGLIQVDSQSSTQFKCNLDHFGFGLGRFFWWNNHGHATSTPPVATTSPIMTNVHLSAVSSTTATVTWKTKVSSDTKIYYSTINPLVIGATTTSIMANSALVTDHSMTLANLATSTKYYFLTQSTNSLNDTRTSNQFTFTTKAN